MSPERYFSPEAFQSNEQIETGTNQNKLAIAEHDLDRAEEVLKEAGIQYKVKQLREREDLGGGGYVAGYHAVELMDPENLGKQASFEYTQKIFELLNKHDVPFGDIEQLRSQSSD